MAILAVLVYVLIVYAAVSVLRNSHAIVLVPADSAFLASLAKYNRMLDDIYDTENIINDLTLKLRHLEDEFDYEGELMEELRYRYEARYGTANIYTVARIDDLERLSRVREAHRKHLDRINAIEAQLKAYNKKLAKLYDKAGKLYETLFGDEIEAEPEVIEDFAFDCDNRKVGHKGLYEGRHNKELNADLWELELGCHHSSVSNDRQKIKVKGKERARKARDIERNKAREFKQAQEEAFYADWDAEDWMIYRYEEAMGV